MKRKVHYGVQKEVPQPTGGVVVFTWTKCRQYWHEGSTVTLEWDDPELDCLNCLKHRPREKSK